MDLRYISEKYDLTKRTDPNVDTTLKSGTITPHDLQDTIHHPIGKLQQTGALETERLALQTAAVLYGMHAPLRLARERVLVSQARRLPPLRSSMLGLELTMGTEDTLSFEDFLNVEVPDDIEMRKSVHSMIEQRLNFNA